MADTETILRRKKMEQLMKMKEWDAICPDNAFVDANVKEEITGRHFKDKRGLCTVSPGSWASRQADTQSSGRL